MAGNGARATSLKSEHSDSHWWQALFLITYLNLELKAVKRKIWSFFGPSTAKNTDDCQLLTRIKFTSVHGQELLLFGGQIGGLICSLRCYLDTATSKCVYIVMVTLKWASGKAVLKQTCLLQAPPPQDTKDHPVVVVVDQAVLRGEEVQSLIFLVYLILLDRKNPNKMLEVVSKATQVLCTLPLRLRALPVHMCQTTQVAMDL